jgi:predicted acylesterase/phospholipase RssA
MPQPRLGLALSGGGYRAAAFHLGVLRTLRARGLLERVAVISAVSGGAVLAAAWVARGREGFAAFEARMRAFLARDLKRRVLLAALRPDRLARLLLDPAYSLTEVMAVVLDRELLGGATLGGLAGVAPRLVVNATCVNHGTGFRFTPERIGDWLVATEDRRTLECLPLSRAVAASAAFPGGFAPIVLRGRDVFAGSRAAPREILLTDGGVDDNLGVQALIAEECSELIVSDGSFPFEADERPLDRYGLPPGRRLAVAALLLATVAWGAARLDVPAWLLALAGVLAVSVLLRLRLAVALFGGVMMRGQRRGLLRRLFAGAGQRPVVYLGLGSALSRESERRLRERGIDVARLRRVRTDLALSRGELDALVALGEALADERLDALSGPRVRALGGTP